MRETRTSPVRKEVIIELFLVQREVKDHRRRTSLGNGSVGTDRLQGDEVRLSAFGQLGQYALQGIGESRSAGEVVSGLFASPAHVCGGTAWISAVKECA